MTVHISTEDLRVLDDGPRVRDLRLAEALEFERPRDIRKLIERNTNELERYGVICATVAQNAEGSSPRGVANSDEVCCTVQQNHPDTSEDEEATEPAKRGRGRPGREYWLNEEQALLVSMLARTDKAADVREMLVRAFMAWRAAHRRRVEGGPIPVPPPADVAFHLQEQLPSVLLPPEDEAAPTDLMAKLAKVRTAHRLFGRRAAARVWQEVGFTVPDEGLHVFRPTRLDEGRRCLAWLLGQEAGEGFPLVRALVEDALSAAPEAIEARRQLIALGMKAFTGGLFISNAHPWLMRVFANTEWDAGRWSETLRHLPGSRPDKTYIGDTQRRGTFVALSAIDEPFVA